MDGRYGYSREFVKTLNYYREEGKEDGEEERESGESVRRGEDYRAIELAYFLR